MLENFRHDVARYRAQGTPLHQMPMRQGLWALAEYRFSHWVRIGAPRALRVPLRVVSSLAHTLVQILTGIDLQPTALIGPGLYIAHFGQIFVNGHAVLGTECTLSQGVTIGNAIGDATAVPHLGDRVAVRPGAKLFGRITVGDDAHIGANAVVTKDVPARAVAAGVPARITLR